MYGAGGSSKRQLREAERGALSQTLVCRVPGKVCPGSAVWGAAVLTERPQRGRVETRFCREGEVACAARGGHSGSRSQVWGTAQFAQVRGRGAWATAGGRRTGRVDREGRAGRSRA